MVRKKKAFCKSTMRESFFENIMVRKENSFLYVTMKDFEIRVSHGKAIKGL